MIVGVPFLVKEMSLSWAEFYEVGKRGVAKQRPHIGGVKYGEGALHGGYDDEMGDDFDQIRKRREIKLRKHKTT